MGRSLTSRSGSFFCAILAALLCLSPAASAQSAPKWTADSVLAMMDAAARDFHSLTANIEHIKYTDVVKDTSTESGQMWLQKKDERMRIEVDGSGHDHSFVRRGPEVRTAVVTTVYGGTSEIQREIIARTLGL